MWQISTWKDVQHHLLFGGMQINTAIRYLSPIRMAKIKNKNIKILTIRSTDKIAGTLLLVGMQNDMALLKNILEFSYKS